MSDPQNGTWHPAAPTDWPLRGLLDGLDDAAAVVETQGRLALVNAALCRLLGRPEADLLGRPLAELWPGGDADNDRADLLRALGGARVEREGPRPVAGGVRVLRTVHAPLRDPGGGSGGALLRVYDITEERARAEQQRLEARLLALGRLASGVAHDFNNALGLVHGQLALLEPELPARGAARDALPAIRQALGHAAALAGQILAFVRREAPVRRNVDLGALVRETAAMLGRTLGRHVRLELHAPGGQPLLWADPGQLTQVVLNLALNARDAMPEGGRLLLEVADVLLSPDDARDRPRARPGRFVRLRVADTGPGIPPEVAGRMFEPLTTTKGPGEGTGLGLAIVADIVDRHGGWVSVRSAPGEGAEFDVYLPLPEAPAPAALPPAEAPMRPSAARVLVVEDEPDLRRVTRLILERGGHRAITADDGRHALEVCAQEADPIHLVVLDQNMPGLSCAEVLRGLGAAAPGLPVLLTSGSSPEELTPELARSVRGFLAKPYDAATLLAAVQAALRPAGPDPEAGPPVAPSGG